MSKTRGSDNSGRSTFSSSHYVPDARSLDAGNGGADADRTREAKDEGRNESDDDRVSYLLFQLSKKKVIRSRGELTIAFLAKLADSIVSLREWIRDDKAPILHIAILSTMTEFYGGVHSQEVSEAAALVERIISEDIEFKVLNK